jgi:methylamine dehydrogenase accessory protein MauD
MAGLDIGEKAPSFVTVDQDGNTIRLEDFRGRRCLLAFISPNCSACPGTIRVLDRFRSVERDVAVLVIGASDRELNAKFAAEYDTLVPILTPDPGLAMELYHVRAVPFLFALDETGVIRAKGVVNREEHLHTLLTTAYGRQQSYHSLASGDEYLVKQ